MSTPWVIRRRSCRQDCEDLHDVEEEDAMNETEEGPEKILFDCSTSIKY